MKSSDMLHQMCHSLLAAADVKVLCKARGLAAEAVKSPGILETLFLSPQGVSDVINSLDRSEVALLHLLRKSGESVGISFFSRVYGEKGSYGTFNQRFQGTFAKVKQRLIRGGLLLWAERWQIKSIQNSKLERSQFSLPVEFYSHLPPLFAAPQEFDGNGNWKPDIARDKLIADLGRAQKKTAAQIFQIESGELQHCGKRFEAAQLIEWQQSGWKQAVQTEEKFVTNIENTEQPSEAVLCLLSELTDDCWIDVEQLAEPLRIFCGKEVDCAAICAAGWEWGLLAKRKMDGKTWYRPAPPQAEMKPHQYFVLHQDGTVSVDLTTVPYNTLEQIISISNQEHCPGGSSSLLLTPNFLKLGRADDELLATESVHWLVENRPAFAELYVALEERRGKTILHQGVTIARVSDLSLKVAIEKALRQNVVSLKNDFIAFPPGFLPDVQRVVKNSGHVIKEITAQ